MMNHDMNTTNGSNTPGNSATRGSDASGREHGFEAFEDGADIAAVTARLDRLAASDRAAAREGFELRLVKMASQAARAQHAAALNAQATSDAPAPIPFAAAREAMNSPRGASQASRGSLRTPMRIAAGLGLAAAALGAYFAQRGSTPQNATPTITVAGTSLTSADVALSEEILDEIFPVTLASLSGDSSESAARAEFWSLDAFSEDSM